MVFATFPFMLSEIGSKNDTDQDEQEPTAGPGWIVNEMLSDIFGIDDIMECMHELNISSDVTNISRSIFVTIHSHKPGGNECELHQTIRLMSHKIMLFFLDSHE